mgnify:CR=1 FL=1
MILNNLYPGQREILHAFIYQGAGQHAGHASLAFFYIDQQVAARNRQTRPAVGQFYDFRQGLFYTGISADADAKGDRPGHSQKVSPRYTIVTAGGLLMMCVIHNFTFPNELNPS